jgi:hypothetical protein
MSSVLTEALCEDFNPDLFLTDPDLTASYARDRTGSYFGLPLAVARPRTTEDVAAIMVRCAELNLRVVPQGGLTGLVGAAVSDANEPEIVVLLDHALAIEVDADEPLHVLQAQEQAAGSTTGVNEWPEPATRTGISCCEAACTSAANSSSEPGSALCRPMKDWLPTQLRQWPPGPSCADDFCVISVMPSFPLTAGHRLSIGAQD